MARGNLRGWPSKRHKEPRILWQHYDVDWTSVAPETWASNLDQHSECALWPWTALSCIFLWPTFEVFRTNWRYGRSGGSAESFALAQSILFCYCLFPAPVLAKTKWRTFFAEHWYCHFIFIGSFVSLSRIEIGHLVCIFHKTLLGGVC